MDSGAPPANRSRCGGPEVFGGPPSVRTAGQWSSPARRRSRAGKNAHGQNNGGMHSNRLSKTAVHAGSFTGGFYRDADIQTPHRGILKKTRPHFFEFDFFRLKQTRARQSIKPLS